MMVLPFTSRDGLRTYRAYSSSSGEILGRGRTHAEAIMEALQKCQGCGCDDLHACMGGCYWVGPGTCSMCAGFPPLHGPGSKCHINECPRCYEVGVAVG